MIRLLFLVFVVLFAGCSKLEFNEGKDSFLHQDYRKAFIRLMPSARAGNAEAQYAIGYMYYTGQGTVQNREEAKLWIAKSAKQGNSAAISALSQLTRPSHSPYTPSTNPGLRPL